MLVRMTVQSWVRGPIVFTVANATKTLEYKAEKLISTSTPQRNIIRFFRGSSKTNETNKKMHTTILETSGFLLIEVAIFYLS